MAKPTKAVLRAKAIELSGLTGEEFDALAADAQKEKITAAADALAADAQKEMPESVTLEKPYGYIHEDESRRFWDAGSVVNDAEQIADLMSRKAPLVGITHDEEE